MFQTRIENILPELLVYHSPESWGTLPIARMEWKGDGEVHVLKQMIQHEVELKSAFFRFSDTPAAKELCVTRVMYQFLEFVLDRCEDLQQYIIKTHRSVVECVHEIEKNGLGKTCILLVPPTNMSRTLIETKHKLRLHHLIILITSKVSTLTLLPRCSMQVYVQDVGYHPYHSILEDWYYQIKATVCFLVPPPPLLQSCTKPTITTTTTTTPTTTTTTTSNTSNALHLLHNEEE